MQRLSDQPVGAGDFEEYLGGYSDFSFELRALKMLRAHGLECEHGGLYEDPVTKKMREFDIRAIMRAPMRVLRLAIECKNVRENFPLLVSCVPRHHDESYHEVAFVQSPRSKEYLPAAVQSRATIVRLAGAETIYSPQTPVGKNLAQVGRAADKGGAIVASDGEVFDKWSQALASANDLVSRSYWEGRESFDICIACVVPIVVVPDARLWTVEYDLDGTLIANPKPANRCSLFVDKSYHMSAHGPNYRISHLELFTITGLSEFVASLLTGELTMKDIFPVNSILSEIKNRRPYG